MKSNADKIISYIKKVYRSRREPPTLKEIVSTFRISSKTFYDYFSSLREAFEQAGAPVPEDRLKLTEKATAEKIKKFANAHSQEIEVVPDEELERLRETEERINQENRRKIQLEELEEEKRERRRRIFEKTELKNHQGRPKPGIVWKFIKELPASVSKKLEVYRDAISLKRRNQVSKSEALLKLLDCEDDEDFVNEVVSYYLGEKDEDPSVAWGALADEVEYRLNDAEKLWADAYTSRYSASECPSCGFRLSVKDAATWENGKYKCTKMGCENGHYWWIRCPECGGYMLRFECGYRCERCEREWPDGLLLENKPVSPRYFEKAPPSVKKFSPRMKSFSNRYLSFHPCL